MKRLGSVDQLNVADPPPSPSKIPWWAWLLGGAGVAWLILKALDSDNDEDWRDDMRDEDDEEDAEAEEAEAE